MTVSLASLDECPVCRTSLAADATECPRCGEPLRDSVAALPGESVENAAPAARVPGFREKFLYYAGIALILLGGPGFALGSWLHDVLRISYMNYNSFDVFGPVNRLVLAVGLIVMIVGIVFLVLSLRLSRPVEPEQAG